LRTSIRFLPLFTASLLLTAGMLSHAQEHYTVGDIHLFDAYARPTVSHQPTAGAYVGIENMGKQADRLISAESPAAKRVEIHTMSMDNHVMKMKEVGTIDLKPGETITMKPGDGFHLMLIGLTQRLKAGDKLPMTLVFEKAGKVEVTFDIDSKQGKSGEHSHSHSHSGHGH